MEIVYSIFIGIIVGMIASKISGIGLQCRRDTDGSVGGRPLNQENPPGPWVLCGPAGDLRRAADPRSLCCVTLPSNDLTSIEISL